MGEGVILYIWPIALTVLFLHKKKDFVTANFYNQEIGMFILALADYLKKSICTAITPCFIFKMPHPYVVKITLAFPCNSVGPYFRLFSTMR
jgi:hypothetical protein